ncbi:MAG: transposase [Desulfobulbus sp.]|jgi:hypothetical protein|nr:transposase [Desulfobulbus sp.]
MQNSGEHAQEMLQQAFHRWFPTEESCVAYLFPLRWPHGFVCPFCSNRHPHLAPQRYLTCTVCGNRSSLTTGTIMHGVKRPLRDWLLAIWWFSGSQFDTSAKELQRLLGVSCYQTAWAWLQKLRQVMGAVDTARCRGVVEIGGHAVTPARKRGEQALILAATETVPNLGVVGRIRLRHVPWFTGKYLLTFLEDTVAERSCLLTSDEQLHRLLPAAAAWLVSPLQADVAPRTGRLCRSFEAYLHSVHRGGVTVRHLQLYLNEFCFRNNSGLLADHPTMFRTLLAGIFHEQGGPGGQAVRWH